MATSPEAVRTQLAVVTAAAVADLTDVAAGVPLEQQVTATLETLPLLVPAYYDAAGSLAVAWYDEIRDESNPASAYAPDIIDEPETDWIEREVAKFGQELAADLDREVATSLLLTEARRLAEKEVARGFRASVTGNTRIDDEAIGWSRVARLGACKFCSMLAAKGAYFRSESSATFAAHKGCNCAARPVFRNGERGPEASAMQYLGSQERSPEQRARLREYLNQHYPDAPG